MDDQCYLVTLTTTEVGQVMEGRWASLKTAERKFTSWIGSYGSMPGARVTLAEQVTDGTWVELKAWPDDEA